MATRHNDDFDEKYVELKKETAEVRVEWKELKDNVDKDMTDMKAYVDNSTKLIIKVIWFSRDEAQKSNDQTVGVVFNADIPGSSNSQPPTLDDYLDFTMTQIVALDPILNANTIPDVQSRNRNLDKYDTSPYIRLTEDESSSRIVPILFLIKHPFESHNGFEVAAELIDELNKWVFKDVSSRCGRNLLIQSSKIVLNLKWTLVLSKLQKRIFFNIMVKPGRPWKDGLLSAKEGKVLSNITIIQYG
ncbi:hypothetical protein KY289_036028 [Solanum tuberosum]|nr:hypothetical protein KY289_036028 [Solanum tuberosum]